MVGCNFFRLVDTEPAPVGTDAPGAGARASTAGGVFDVVEGDDAVVAQDGDAFVLIVFFNPAGRADLVEERLHQALLGIGAAIAEEGPDIGGDGCGEYEALCENRRSLATTESPGDHREAFRGKNECSLGGEEFSDPLAYLFFEFVLAEDGGGIGHALLVCQIRTLVSSVNWSGW